MELLVGEASHRMGENPATNIEALRESFSQQFKLSVCCPLCGGDKNLPLTNLDRHDLGLNVIACRHCGMGMMSPRPTSKWFDEFYENHYWPIYISSRFQDLSEMYVKDDCVERAEQIFTAITPSFQQAPSSYLDVGCGQGAMLAEFRKRYPTAVYVGVEPSPDAAEFCRRYHGLTVEVVEWNSLDADKIPGPFDLITLIHVLEHVLDPVGVLTRAVRRLSEKSLIYVEVPDLLSDEWSGKDFFHIAHVWYFHELALRNLFTRSGLDVVSITRGAAEVWPWAIGLVGQRSTKGPQPPEAVPGASEEFKLRLSEHVVGRQLPVATKALQHPKVFPRMPKSKTLSAFKARTRNPLPAWLKAPVHDLIKKFTSVRIDEIQALERQLEAADKLLEFVTTDDTNRWLYINREERMDAALEIFDETRRRFHLDRYRFAAKHVRGKSVLDCASGTGYGVRLLLETGKARLAIGVDSEVKAVEYASKKHGALSSIFLCASGDQLPLEAGSMDVVTSFETIEHVPDDFALLKEFHRVLRPGGLLIISTPNQWPLSVAPFHVREYDRTSFQDVLDKGFECMELYNQNSGSETPYNHRQSSGLVRTTNKNEQLAECYLAVCTRKPSWLSFD
jgi:SAM-dependent methyltransferase